MQVDEFITGWLRMTLAEREQCGVSREDLQEGQWVCGFDDDFWVLPGSQTETDCRAKGIAFINE